MGWQEVASLGSVVVALLLGLLTYTRGAKSDQALDIATNVKTTFEAQQALVNDLQEELVRNRNLAHDCEKSCIDLRRKLAQSLRLVSEQEAEISKLKSVVSEHEATIAKHEKTINSMSRRTDQKPRQGEEERRQS